MASVPHAVVSSTPTRAVFLWSLLASALCALPFSGLGWWWVLGSVAATAASCDVALSWRRRVIVTTVAWLPCWITLEGWLFHVTGAGTVVLIAYLAAWSALVPTLTVRVRQALGTSREWLAFPAVLVAVEWCRARPVWNGYSWFQSGHALIDATLPAQAADLFGIAGLTLVLGVVGQSIATLQPGMRTPWRARCAAAAVGLSAFCISWGAWRLVTVPTRAGLRVVAVQTDVETSNKIRWTPERQVADFQQALQLTADGWSKLQAGHHADWPALVAWPETSVPGMGLDRPIVDAVVASQAWPGDRFSRALFAMQRQLALPMLVGSAAFVGLSDDGDRWVWQRQFNSAYMLDRGAIADRYDKVYLTPFGETMPYISESDWLESHLLALGAAGMTFDLNEGEETRNLLLPGTTLRIAVPICFEDTVAHVVARLASFPAPADCIVNLSNDGWFGDSDAGRRHHEMMARWRAIELRLPLVRVANTGESSWTDSCGRVERRAPARAATMLLAEPMLDGRDTLVRHVGDILPIVSVLAVSIALCPVRRRWMGVVVTVALVAMSGCASDPKSPPKPNEEWSSRALSITPDPALPSTKGAKPIFAAPEGAGLRASAVAILRQACAAEYPQLRANAIEALVNDRAALIDCVGPLLADPNPAVRYAACIAVGRAKLAPFAAAIKPLLTDPSHGVRAGAIYALQRVGANPDQSPLAGMAGATDLTTRGIAIYVLGEIGNPTAIPVLHAALQRPTDSSNAMRARIVDLQVAEALAKLGDRSQLDPVRAALLAPSEQGELVCLGAQILGNVKDQTSEALLLTIVGSTGRTERPAEVRLLAGDAAIKMGSARTSQICAYARGVVTSGLPMVRAQAATTLGSGGMPMDAEVVAPLLRDPNALVQLAAAQAILKCAPPDSTSGTVKAD